MALLTDGDLVGLAAVYGYVTSIVLVTWALKGKMRNPRKAVHILTGGIVFFWWIFDSPIVMAGLAALPFVPVLLLATPRSPVKRLRASPLGSHSSEGHTYGLVLYAISWTIVAYFLFDDLYAASVAIAAMSFGDGMGELIGRRYGRLRYSENRSLEGSMAVFVATFFSVVVLAWFYFSFIGHFGGEGPDMLYLFGAAVAGLVTVLEAVTPGSIDNLVIPLILGGFLHTIGV